MLNIRKTFVISLTSLIALLVSSIGVTFAWYVSATTLNIENFNISLVSDPTLSIGIKDENDEIKYYKNEIPSSAIKKYYVEKFRPVSSMFSDNWINEHKSFPTFKDRYINPSILNEETYKENKNATDGFFQIELFLKSESDIYVGLSKDTYIKGNEKANQKKAKELIERYKILDEETIYNSLNNIDHSLRISLLDSDLDSYSYTIIDPYKDKDTYYSGALDTDGKGYYDSYASSDGKRKEYYFGEYENEDKMIYKLNEEDSPLNGHLTSFNSRHAKNTYILDEEESIKNGFIRKKENSISLNEATKNDEFIALVHDTPKRIVLSLYIEGWDLDNTNYSEYGSFTSLFKFDVRKENIL